MSKALALALLFASTGSNAVTSIADITRDVSGSASIHYAAISDSGALPVVNFSQAWTGTGTSDLTFSNGSAKSLGTGYGAVNFSTGYLQNSPIQSATFDISASWSATVFNPYSVAQAFTIVNTQYGDRDLGLGSLYYGASVNGVQVGSQNMGDIELGILNPGESRQVTFSATYAGTALRDVNGDFGGQGYGYFGIAGFNSVPVAPVPEPGTYAMLAAGLGFIMIMRRRKYDHNRL